ncbi:MAG: hypothetical protein K8I03_03320 [Ignavibacteria bacterium]|nr:hypothetical protein [Ignavibacteria bacterium]
MPLYVIYPQQNSSNDSLLDKIRDIEIALDAPVESEENLFMNTVSFQSFYDVLLPMGEWIQITKEDIDEEMSDGEGEGYSSLNYGDEEFLFIWKPSVENNWRPYVNGKWEYTDRGWLWISSDKWGNQTFNYGRWWNSPKYGWVWLPGYTWAPAWVRWKVSNDGNYVGWVALSPKAKWRSEEGITEKNYNYKNKEGDWVFVDNNTFTGDIAANNVLNNESSNKLIQNSKTITDIKTDDDIIVNNGPDVNTLENKTGKKFNRKKLRFGSGHNNTMIGGNEVVIGRESFEKKDNNSSLVKPNKYRKSERVKKMIKKRQGKKKPPRIKTGRP